VFELVDDGRRLRLRAGAGFRADDVPDATVPAGWQESQEGFTLIRREPVIVIDARAERRFEQAELIRRHQARSGVTVIVQGRAGPHAVLSAHSARPGAFSPEDVAFLQSMANVLGDALDRWRNEEEIRRRGLHDALTELPNRALVMDRLAQALARTDRRPGQIALIFLDLDHFKVINDSFGHTAGDVVLREAARRLRMTVRPGDTVGRFGGDEFVVLCEEVEGEAMALAIAERLVDAFSQPFAIAEDRHSVGVSIGVALYDHSGDAESLLRDADAAMYRAKDRGRGRVEVFDTGMRARAAGRLQVEAALRRALDSSQLAVLYQPVVNLADGSLAAIEALVRWNHPTDGLLTPGAFVPIAEESGLIVPLGRRVLELACLQAVRWARVHPSRPPLTVHVNLSSRQLNDQALVESVAATMAATGAPPGSLTFEITESTLVDRGPAKLRLLERLRDLGVDLMLDHFGTGWSSLGYLTQMPIGGLKIDRSFVAAISGEHAPIVDAVVRLAGAFDLRVVAEGVEQEEQLAVLRAMGCELAQGFLFARPMTAEQIDELLLAGETPFATERAVVLSRPQGAADRA
jgi:diguanylate cyclase (GGDEF)-like protein